MPEPVTTVRVDVVVIGHGDNEQLHFPCGFCTEEKQRFHIAGRIVIKRCERGHDYDLDFLSTFGKVYAVFTRPTISKE